MEHKNNKLDVIKNKFNEILSGHIKKLLDSYYETFGLSFNLPELSCLALIQEQISGQSDNFPFCLENYSREKLFDEVSDLGMETGAELDMAFDKLIQKKYIHIDENKNICVNKLTKNVTILLDRIHPNMCGINLLAYIIQTMDEAISGRKELASAIDQFDQTLQLHGVMLKNQEGQQEQIKAAASPSSSNLIYQKKVKPYIRNQQISGRIEPGTGNGSSIIKSGNLIKSLYTPFSESSITPISERENIKVIEDFSLKDNKNGETGKNNSTEYEKDSNKISPDEIINEREIIEKKELNIRSDNFKECSNIEKPLEPDSENDLSQKNDLNESPDNIEKIFTADISNKTAESDVSPVSDETESEDNTTNSFLNEDNLIENQIAAFGEELSMQCPVCNSGKVISNTTLKNKIYFRCSNKQCSFISWGKPYYLSCPKCSNNFLIESIQSDGQKMLRCPRATCRYTQRIPGEQAGDTSIIDNTGQKSNSSHLPVKRVVRKRVVRRRK
ncbi:MAG: hypothetical protein KJ882_06495 [Proteobacteria bacterium]|nr:hypothetical protein [Pseudomonadota bacterium]MBU4010399.1 hypothetical protein [Pseudomonadota bacterium]